MCASFLQFSTKLLLCHKISGPSLNTSRANVCLVGVLIKCVWLKSQRHAAGALCLCHQAPSSTHSYTVLLRTFTNTQCVFVRTVENARPPPKKRGGWEMRECPQYNSEKEKEDVNCFHCKTGVPFVESHLLSKTRQR